MSEIESAEKFAKRIEYTLSCANDLDRDTARLLIEKRDAAIAAAARREIAAWLRSSPECIRNGDCVYGPYQDAAELLAERLLSMPTPAPKEGKDG